MKRLHCVVALVALLCWALPTAFGSASSETKEADKLFAKAEKADKADRFYDAFDAYSQARTKYDKVMKKYQDYKPKYMLDQMMLCSGRITALEMRLEQRVLKEEAEAAKAAKEEEAAENNPPPPSDGISTDATPAEAKRPYVMANTGTPSAEDIDLSATIQQMLADGRGVDAVMLLEGLLEDSKDSPTLTQYLLFAQALMNRRNYPRAERILVTLHDSYPDHPSLLLLISGLYVAQGELGLAQHFLERFIELHPKYPEGYINMAYVRFAQDTKANRDEAIMTYRVALSLGATRDPRLEAELRVNITD